MAFDARRVERLANRVDVAHTCFLAVEPPGELVEGAWVVWHQLSVLHNGGLRVAISHLHYEEVQLALRHWSRLAGSITER
jgi:hypothetical protein